MDPLFAITGPFAHGTFPAAIDSFEATPLLLADAGFGKFFGRFHPIVIHFPIALLIVAALIESVRLLSSKARRPTSFGLTAVIFAAVFGVLSAASGWLNAEHEGAEATTDLFLHRWLGVSVAGLSVVLAATAILAAIRREPADQLELEELPPSRTFAIYRYGLIVAAVLVAFTGHLGGELVYGDGYLMKAWPDSDDDAKPEPKPIGDASSATADPSTPAAAGDAARDGAASSGDGPIDPAASQAEVALDGQASLAVLASRDPGTFFASHVLPVFDARCVECHGPDKAKAGLRLDSLAAALEGEGEDAMVVAGDPESSELLRRVLLPRDDDEAMPPKGDGLAPEQIEAIRAWIAAMPAG
jgi:uncharacterized membrane protein/mono/diheme cytochrome c family protein